MNSPPAPLSDSERLDRLRLIRTVSIGPRSFVALLSRYGSAAAAIEAVPEMARRGGRSKDVRVAARETAEAEMEAVAAIGGRMVVFGEAAYPARLAAIADPPATLCVLGDADLLQREKSVAIVGARNASGSGRGLARDIAAELREAGCVVVSGMARGIDTAAHEGALPGATVAVVAGGADVVYPPENAGLYTRIVETGTVISEHPPGMQPTARHFPPRNRMVAGLSMGVLVVEAAQRSGSLITARMALEQGREVFAVPGSPRDPRCRGSNDLLRQGAALTESASDILDALDGTWTTRPAGGNAADLNAFATDGMDADADDDARRRVVEMLGPTPLAVDELVRECQVTASVVMTVLLELELAGRLERHPGQRVSLLL